MAKKLVGHTEAGAPRPPGLIIEDIELRLEPYANGSVNIPVGGVVSEAKALFIIRRPLHGLLNSHDRLEYVIAGQAVATIEAFVQWADERPLRVRHLRKK